MSSHVAMGVLIGTALVDIILSLTLLPMIIWIFVIPKIENRVGHKLKFHPQYDFFPFGRYFIGYVEIALTLSLMYLSLKVFQDAKKIKLGKECALVLARYDISTASQVELVLSFIVFSCLIFFVISLLLMFLIPYVYPFH